MKYTFVAHALPFELSIEQGRSASKLQREGGSSDQFRYHLGAHASPMLMKFTIEQRHLTDRAGKPVADPAAVSFHTCEAENVDEAVRLFISADRGEVIGNILKFPGFHAVATVRDVNGVYTLQVSPSSQNRIPMS